MSEAFKRYRAAISVAAGTAFGAVVWLVNGPDAEPVAVILAVVIGAVFAISMFLGSRRAER